MNSIIHINRISVTTPADSTVRFNVYLDGEFENLLQLTRLFEILNSPQSSVYDIHIFIRTLGGDITTATTLHTMIKESRAKVTVHVLGIVASSGVLIPLSAGVVRLYPNSKFVMHNPFILEAEGFTVATLEAIQQDNIETLLPMYGNFLTKEELNMISSGEELFIGLESLKDRFKITGQLK